MARSRLAIAHWAPEKVLRRPNLFSRHKTLRRKAQLNTNRTEMFCEVTKRNSRFAETARLILFDAKLLESGNLHPLKPVMERKTGNLLCALFLDGLSAGLARICAGPATAATNTSSSMDLPDSNIGLSPDKVPEACKASARVSSPPAWRLGTGCAGMQAAGCVTGATPRQCQSRTCAFHGFDASPLQGTPRPGGLSEWSAAERTFGRTVNWDAVPQPRARMEVWRQQSCVRLNALGGAVNMVMKNGFNWQGADAFCRAVPMVMAWPAAMGWKT